MVVLLASCFPPEHILLQYGFTYSTGLRLSHERRGFSPHPRALRLPCLDKIYRVHRAEVLLLFESAIFTLYASRTRSNGITAFGANIGTRVTAVHPRLEVSFRMAHILWVATKR